MTCDDLTANDSWGDEITVKNNYTVRIYSQNLNSCKLSQGMDKWNDIMTSMSKASCDIMNFVQTSANWKLLEIRNRMHAPVCNHMPIYKLIVGKNRFDSTQMNLLGGTAQIANGDWTGRITQNLQDQRGLGRLCGTKLRLKHDRSLYIISAYRVCDQCISEVGIETAFGQQHDMLSMEGFTYPQPHCQFNEDLMTYVKSLQSELDEIMILMDANEQLGTSTQGLTYLMRECKLVDLFHQNHGVCPAFTTYGNGNRRLDYAIGSSPLVPFIQKCGYLPFYQGVSSDHRGLFVDLSL